MAIERIIPGTPEWEAFYANHIFRYQFAKKQIAKPKSILDAACGVGYGTHYLASKYDKVPTIGIDISAEAIKIAYENFSGKGISFIKDDCEIMGAVTQTFSHIVSFETFEHLKNPKKFLIRLHELLEAKGKIIISTPNASVTSPDGRVDWEFHETEYKATAFFELLKGTGFDHIQLYGQSFSTIGKFKNLVRKDLNRLNHNPFIRMGKWIQRVFIGHEITSVALPEEVDDFEMISFDTAEECENLGLDGPFVIIAIAEKN